MNRIKRPVFDLTIALFCIALDQFTKWLAASFLPPEVSTEIFSLFGIELFWTLTTNMGAAWGVLTDLPSLLLVLRFGFIVVLFGMYASSKTPLNIRTAIALIISGALSNIFDTLYRGYVIDMIHFRFWGWNYPIFNIADICICMGAFSIVWMTLFHKR